MNVLVLAPHPDDEAIGCGGAVCMHMAQGDDVRVVFLSSGELGLSEITREEAWRIREREAVASAAVLGVSDVAFLRYPDWFISDHIQDICAGVLNRLGTVTPDRIYFPHPAEWHPDHQGASRVVRELLGRWSGRTPQLRAYEVWTPISEYDEVEDISLVMRQKMHAIRCYRSQLSYFRYDRAVRGINQYRGALAGRCLYAEVFQSTLACLESDAAESPSAGEFC